MVPQSPRRLIEAIRERYKTSAGQLVDPVFVVGRVTCIVVLVEDDEDEEDEEEDEDEGENGAGEGVVGSYMYSYRMELFDSSGEKITGVLRPGLHEPASEEVFTQGVRVKLTEWRVREAVTRGGKAVMLVCLSMFSYTHWGRANWWGIIGSWTWRGSSSWGRRRRRKGMVRMRLWRR